jgi:hypothetical protein
MAKLRAWLSIILVGLLLAVVIHHVRVVVFSENLHRVILSDMSLLNGKPQWRIFQSRLLGPSLANVLMREAGADVGYTVFDLLGFGAAGVMAWRIGAIIVGSRAGALAATFCLGLGFVALFVPDWFYAWDVLGPAFFMIFAYLVVTEAKPRTFALLFAIAIWNREDALLMALYLIVQPLLDWWAARAHRQRTPLDWRSVVTGIICVACGVILISTLRRLLMVHEMGPDLYADKIPMTPFFHWNVQRNLDTVLHYMSWTSVQMPAFMILPPLAVIASCVYLIRVAERRYAGYALVNLGMVLATVLFGFTPELRQWVDSLPAIVLAVSFALARADAAVLEPRGQVAGF